MSKLTGYIIGGIQIVAGIVLTAFGGSGVPLIISGVMTIAGTALAETPEGTDGFRSSPTYGWAPTNATFEGAPKTIVLGEHVISPKYISSQTIRDGKTQIIKGAMFVAAGGPYGIESISDITLNGEPIESFPEASYEVKLGTSDQETVDGFEFVAQPHEVNARCEKDEWITYTTRDEVDEVNLIFGWMRGLYHVGTKGIVDAWWKGVFEYEDIEEDGEVSGVRRRATLNQISQDAYHFRALEQPGVYKTRGQTQSPKYGHARIKFTTRKRRKIYVKTINGDHEKDVSTPTWLRTEEILNDSRAYAGNAMLYLTMPGTAQLSGGLPRVQCKVRGWKVKNLGDSSAAWTRNPAKLRYAFMTDVKNGAGRWVSESDLDSASFILGATWHDENAAASGVHKQPRHQMDLVIDSVATISQWLAHFDKLYPATVVEHTGKMYYLTDDADKTSVATFDGRQTRDSANRPILRLQDGRADIKETELENDKRATHVRAKYFDREDDNVARFTDWIVDPDWNADLPRIDRELSLQGITREAEAIRNCRREIQNARYRNKVYEIGIGIGDLQVLPMDLITLYADSPALSGVTAIVLATRIESLHAGKIVALLWDSAAFEITGDSLQPKAVSLTRALALKASASIATGVSNIKCREVA